MQELGVLTMTLMPAASTATLQVTTFHNDRPVHHMPDDVSRHKQNVTISGLPTAEETGIDDRQTFLEMCETFLPVTPSLMQRFAAVHESAGKPY